MVPSQNIHGLEYHDGSTLALRALGCKLNHLAGKQMEWCLALSWIPLTERQRGAMDRGPGGPPLSYR